MAKMLKLPLMSTGINLAVNYCPLADFCQHVRVKKKSTEAILVTQLHISSFQVFSREEF